MNKKAVLLLSLALGLAVCPIALVNPAVAQPRPLDLHVALLGRWMGEEERGGEVGRGRSTFGRVLVIDSVDAATGELIAKWGRADADRLATVRGTTERVDGETVIVRFMTRDNSRIELRLEGGGRQLAGTIYRAYGNVGAHLVGRALRLTRAE